MKALGSTVGLGIFSVLLFICSCGGNEAFRQSNYEEAQPGDPGRSTQLSEAGRSEDIYFRASGNEPFWLLQLSKEYIQISTLSDTLIAPAATPTEAMDANIKSYRTKVADALISIEIIQSGCINDMSGAASPYRVNLIISGAKQNQRNGTFSGCGNYITDYRLHDIWVLEKLYKGQATSSDFSKELPRLEINSSKNIFIGFTGCKTMNGTIFYEKNILRFIDIESDNKSCGTNNKEPEFLNALRSSTTYKIENNRLWLSNPSNQTLVFKKID